MYDALGRRPDDRALSPARLSTSSWSSTRTRPIASPASRRCGTRRWPLTPFLRPGSAGAEPAGGPGMARAAAGPRRYGRLGAQRPAVRPGGWAFQYRNALPRSRRHRGGCHGHGPRRGRVTAGRPSPAIARGREWVEGLQSRDGGWAAFDADNTYHYLNNIPFADHGALLDPPTTDVAARCVSMLAQLGETTSSSACAPRFCYQEKRWSWFGRWGMNYIYGTWSALCALTPPASTTLSLCARRPIG